MADSTFSMSYNPDAIIEAANSKDMGNSRLMRVIKYELIGQEIGRLVAQKQEAYGDSFGRSGEVLRILYPNGIQPEQYDDMMAVVRILDKLFRIANQKNAFGESPYRDIAGYAILGVAREEAKKHEAS